MALMTTDLFRSILHRADALPSIHANSRSTREYASCVQSIPHIHVIGSYCLSRLSRCILSPCGSRLGPGPNRLLHSRRRRLSYRMYLRHHPHEAVLGARSCNITSIAQSLDCNRPNGLSPTPSGFPQMRVCSSSSGPAGCRRCSQKLYCVKQLR